MTRKNLEDLAEGVLRHYKDDFSEENYEWLISIAKERFDTFLDFIILIEDRERKRTVKDIEETLKKKGIRGDLLECAETLLEKDRLY